MPWQFSNTKMGATIWRFSFPQLLRGRRGFVQYRLFEPTASASESPEETHWLTNLANTSALLFSELEALNWVGFYLLRMPSLS